MDTHIDDAPHLPPPSAPPPFALELMADNVPGGMFSCINNDDLTLLQMNEGFCAMLGYTRTEIHTLFHNSFWEMIDPRDRENARAEAIRQTTLSPDKEIEYRMRRKDGGVIWVLDKGRLFQGGEGGDYFCCMLVDITRSKDLEYRLRLLLDRHQIILNQTNDIIFEWDILSDRLDVSSNWEKKLGVHPASEQASLFLPSLSQIHPSERAAFWAMLDRIRRGVRYEEAEVRFLDRNGRFLWCRVRVTGQQRELGHTVKAVGVIVDIDSEKRQAQRLLDSAQRDALTKLYNRGAMQEQITESLATLEPGKYAALLIIDLDNFKLINDTMGHLSGDALLLEIAKILQAQFRDGDLVGRVGGDEFVVFLPGIPNNKIALQKAEQITQALKGMSIRELGVGTVTCSIGLAFAPTCGHTYHELFQRADQALYQAKRLGKDRVLAFDPTELCVGFPSPACQACSEVSDKIDSNEGIKSLTSRITEYIFHVLYRSKNVEVAVQTILEIVGKQFDVSRAYIFENSEDNRYCCNTFEWCNEGVTPEIGNLSHISYESDLGGVYEQNFNESGIFYCRDVRELLPSQYQLLTSQGVKSLLQCAIYDNGVFKGFVGFDECRTNRFWTQEQIATLSFISEILSIFLLKQRAQDRLVQSARAMEAILDNQSSWIYIINPETFELLYINQKTRELVPDIRVGGKCHFHYFDNLVPCSFCPLKQLSSTNSSYTMEIYNPKLKVWTTTDVGPIDWNGERAILVTCHDITAYKQTPSAGKER